MHVSQPTPKRVGPWTRKRNPETHRFLPTRSRPWRPVIDLARAGMAATLMSLLWLPGHASAEPRPLAARVIWVRDDRIVYIALPESAAVKAGALLTFVAHGKNIAAGEVSGVEDGVLAVARLTSGSLEAEKRLDRLEILIEPSSLGPLPLLRVGYPSRDRSSLVFGCGRATLRPPAPEGCYRIETSGERSYRLVRDSTVAAHAPWPDTLVVRLFDDSADEEIALENGDLDLAVFWPGELSAHLRETPRWQGFPYGIRARVVLAAIALDEGAAGASGSIAAHDRPIFAALNRELFRGDLAPWEETAGAPSEPAAQPDPHTEGAANRTAARPDAGSPGTARAGVDPNPRPPGTMRVEVDPSLPGRLALEHFFGRSPKLPLREDGPRLHVFYLDAPIHDLDSLALGVVAHVRAAPSSPALRARAGELEAEVRRLAATRDSLGRDRLRHFLDDSSHVSLLFAMRCPVVCAPQLRPYVETLGAEAFVDMLECPPARVEP